MKLQFKHQDFQLEAVSSIVDLFQGQPRQAGLQYLADPGRGEGMVDSIEVNYRNAPIRLSEQALKDRIRQQQISQHLAPSDQLSITRIKGRPSYNLSIEMETGTGKTYTYIRTIMELNKQYGWIKFIIVVPSVAIREGVLKSFQMTAEHFQQEYEKKPRFFVYDSKRLGDLDTFANSADIQVMIINSQAFNAKGADARRIRMEQEAFRWRKPIDVIAATHPILIIDEPQSVEGKQTKESLLDFAPLMTLRYSATHKDKHDMVYRLDAMDAYNKQLVKKIGVKTIEQTGSLGTDGYLYLQELVLQPKGKPKARIEFEVLGKNGLRRQTRLVEEPFDLYAESGELEAYRDGWTLSDFDARYGTIRIGANRTLAVGEVIGDQNEALIRRLQIRETIKSHLEKEETLYDKGIKVLSLFFIDEVAKYKRYDENNQAFNGDYAQIFEEEYSRQVRDYLSSHKASSYRVYLERQAEARRVHAGYFSIDKSKKTAGQFIDPKASEKKNDSSNDQDAYDLIMRDKERLLSFDEPVRFLFSHSALKEGWDNTNVFQICTLKQSSADTRKRQEIGRGMRLAVDQFGVRQDKELLGDLMHEVNRLTVIANESYDDFARSLQAELTEDLKDRPIRVDAQLFARIPLRTNQGQERVLSESEAKQLEHAFIQQGYVDASGQLTATYYEAVGADGLRLPEALDLDVSAVEKLVATVYTPSQYSIDHENTATIRFKEQVNAENLARREFQALWKAINRKTVYQVTYDDQELVDKCVTAINDKLVVKKLTYQVTEQEADQMTAQGLDFSAKRGGSHTGTIKEQTITTTYDLLGELAERTGLTRRLIADVLSRIHVYQFDRFKQNPEDFLLKVAKLINEQKARQVIEHIQYRVLDETFDQDIFYDTEETAKLSDERLLPADKGIYRHIKVDSLVEAQFQKDLERYADVQVYTKLPAGFTIPTPLGDYNPDWAIAFKEGTVKHLYFVAETKGSMSSLQLKAAEEAKIACAKAHFKALTQAGLLDHHQIYGVVTSYQELLELVRG